jgi:hypothetical protein
MDTVWMSWDVEARFSSSRDPATPRFNRFHLLQIEEEEEDTTLRSDEA